MQALGLRIRIIVVESVAEEEHNAMLHLFSAREELLRYGREHFRPRCPETSTLLYQLFKTYSEEPDMSDKLKEFVRQTIKEMLASLSVEERLEGLPSEERLKGLPAEERLKGLSAKERLMGLSEEDLMRDLPAEILESLERKLRANGHSSKSDS